MTEDVNVSYSLGSGPANFTVNSENMACFSSAITVSSVEPKEAPSFMTLSSDDFGAIVAVDTQAESTLGSYQLLVTETDDVTGFVKETTLTITVKKADPTQGSIDR